MNSPSDRKVRKVSFSSYNYFSETKSSPSLKKKRGTNPTIIFGDLANFKKNNRDEEQDDGENINDEEVGDL
jgi:hypothetical protein